MRPVPQPRPVFRAGDGLTGGGRPEAEFPRAGNEPRDQHDGIEVDRYGDRSPRGAGEGRAGEDPRATAEHRMTMGTVPRGGLIVISAPSGAGKTSIARAILERTPHTRFSVSATTRKKRAAEQEGIDYFFL